MSLTTLLVVLAATSAEATVVPTAAPTRPPTFQPEANGLVYIWNGRPLVRYQGRAESPPRPEIPAVYTRGGYLSEIRAPSGRLVTDDYPPNHLHHHGIWFAWVKTRFEGRTPDFWNMGEGKGTVEFVSADPSGESFNSVHRHVDLGARPPKEVAREEWRVVVHAPADARARRYFIDFTSTFAVSAKTPLVLERYHYGGLGVRGHRDWNGPAAVRFVTSEGCGRPAGNETRVRWVDMSGTVEGHVVGITALDHPANFRSPQPVRLHPDQPYFSLAPEQLGEFPLAPGERHVSRYRFVVHDGDLDARETEALWQAFAAEAVGTPAASPVAKPVTP